MYWLPKLTRPMIFVPECPFRINPDSIRSATGLNMAVQHDRLWLVSEEAARDHADEIPFLCAGDLLEGMLIDGSTSFLLPVLYPLWNPGEWSESLSLLADLARTRWVTITADVSNARFKLTLDQVSGTSDIKWPTSNLAETVETAFAGRYIGADVVERNRAFRKELALACDY